MFDYKPFTHEGIDAIRAILEIARKQPDDFNGSHVKVLIFINAIDYVAKNLLINLQRMTFILTQNEFNSIFFYINEKSEDLDEPLGTLIKKLDRFAFPDKDNFILGLKKFSEYRNKCIHNMFSRVGTNKAREVDEAMNSIPELAEKILFSYDSIVRGVRNEWENYRIKFNNTNYPQVNKNLIYDSERESE